MRMRCIIVGWPRNLARSRDEICCIFRSISTLGLLGAKVFFFFFKYIYPKNKWLYKNKKYYPPNLSVEGREETSREEKKKGKESRERGGRTGGTYICLLSTARLGLWACNRVNDSKSRRFTWAHGFSLIRRIISCLVCSSCHTSRRTVSCIHCVRGLELGMAER